MSRYVEDVDKARKYLAGGMEQGSDLAAQMLPSLIGRIAELEKALFPFAYVGKQDNGGLPLTQVHYKDCVTALQVLAPRGLVEKK